MAEKETPVPAAKQSERKELQTLNKRNYQKELDKLIENIQKNAQTFSPRLLCTLQQLCDGISVTVF